MVIGVSPVVPALAHAVSDGRGDGGGAVPPEPTLLTALLGWQLEIVPALLVVVLAGLYLYGVSRLRRRGDSWPAWRTVSFVGLGLGSIVLATQSALAAYDTVLLTPHMIQHMVLAMLTPVLLALGAPVTLALRVLPAWGRRPLVRLLHSRLARVLSFPLVGGALFVASPFALYFSPWYEATLRSAYLHEALHIHFLLVGCLWFWPLLGIDPVPGRLSYPLRMLAIFATLPFHAWLGVAIMSRSTVLAADWYAGLDRSWGPPPLVDQQWAGGLLWASGDIVGLFLLAVLFAQWVRSSEREARREDRRLDLLEAQGRSSGFMAQR